MVKPKSNFFLTAAGLHLGILGISALSYWFIRGRSQSEIEGEDDTSSPQSSSKGTVGREERLICGKCGKEIELGPVATLSCGHKVHGHCIKKMETDDFTYFTGPGN